MDESESKALADQPKDERLGEGWSQPTKENMVTIQTSQGEVEVWNRRRSPATVPVGIRRKPHVVFTEERQNVFLIEYANTGLFAHSADVAGVASETVRTYMKKEDIPFGSLVKEAKEYFSDSIKREAYRRAVDGVLEPVFNQKSGTQIGVIRKYDSRLLEILMKANDPEMFREKKEVDHTFKGGVLVAPAQSPNMDEWERQYGDQVAGPAGAVTEE